MQRKMIKLATGVAGLLLMATSAQATLKTEKVTLKGNMQVKYNKLPQAVDSLSEAFTEGMFYGRFRANFFYWDWSVENYATGGKQKDNKNNGVGGSLIYKTAPFKGVSATVGMYTSQNLDFFRMDKSDVKYSKSGKDTFSRYNVITGGHYGMTVLAQVKDCVLFNLEIIPFVKLDATQAIDAGPPLGLGTHLKGSEHFLVSLSIIPNT